MLPCFGGDRLLTAEKLNHETEVINKVIFNEGNKSCVLQESEQGTVSEGSRVSLLRWYSSCPEANYNLSNP